MIAPSSPLQDRSNDRVGAVRHLALENAFPRLGWPQLLPPARYLPAQHDCHHAWSDRSGKDNAPIELRGAAGTRLAHSIGGMKARISMATRVALSSPAGTLQTCRARARTPGRRAAPVGSGPRLCLCAGRLLIGETLCS